MLVLLNLLLQIVEGLQVQQNVELFEPFEVNFRYFVVKLLQFLEKLFSLARNCFGTLALLYLLVLGVD